MATTKTGDLVAGIPYGNQGKKKWVTVGALLKRSDNDESKGPGYTVALDAWFNLAGLPISEDGTVYLSVFHPKAYGAPEKPFPRQPRQLDFDGDENDLPY